MSAIVPLGSETPSLWTTLPIFVTIRLNYSSLNDVSKSVLWVLKGVDQGVSVVLALSVYDLYSVYMPTTYPL